MALQEGARYTVRITSAAGDGDGIVRLENAVVFVRDALPGELAEITIEHIGHNAVWARADRILEPSEARIEPDCPQYARCGGCRFRHMTYEAELEIKRQRVQDALQRIGGLSLTVPPVHGAVRQDRYRNKVQFPVAPGPRIGFFQERTHKVTDIPDCLLQPEQDAAIRNALHAWMKQHRIPAYDERTHTGLIRHLYLRTNAQGQTLCCLVVRDWPLPHGKELVSALRGAEPNLVGIVLSRNDKRTNVVLGNTYQTLWGQDWLEETLCGLSFRLSVPSFFQVNREQCEVLYGIAMDFAGLTGKELAVDLYCGIGTISLCLARKAGRVIGVEVVPEAIEDAKKNAQRNGLADKTKFVCGDAGQLAEQLARDGLQPDVLVVDPPRKGISEGVIQAAVQMGPQRIVYVSCDPATLARDLKNLRQYGYEPVKAEAVDMFPRCAHVESICKLVHRKK